MYTSGPYLSFADLQSLSYYDNFIKAYMVFYEAYS